VSLAQPAFLVTGATGFLGRHVIGAVRAADPRARILALVRDPLAESLGRLSYLEGVELITGSPLDPEKWQDDPRLAGLDGIYHLAAEVKHSRTDSEAMFRLNVEGARAMVKVAHAKDARMIFVSTSGTVGCSSNADHSPDESAPFCEDVVGRWPYYMSKIVAERSTRQLAHELGAGLVIMRPPVLLGPGDHRFRSIGNVMRVLRGRLPFVISGGMNFVDVRDAAAAMVAAMNHSSPRPVYNLPGTASSLDGFFRRVARIAGIDPGWRVLPSKLVWMLARLNEIAGKPLHILPDPVVIEMGGHYWGISSRHAATDLGYSTRDPDVTIADTIEWIRAAEARQHT
jgi:dihydroflavonol-4-reductase